MFGTFVHGPGIVAGGDDHAAHRGLQAHQPLHQAPGFVQHVDIDDDDVVVPFARLGGRLHHRLGFVHLDQAGQCKTGAQVQTVVA